MIIETFLISVLVENKLQVELNFYKMIDYFNNVITKVSSILVQFGKVCFIYMYSTSCMYVWRFFSFLFFQGINCNCVVTGYPTGLSS